MERSAEGLQYPVVPLEGIRGKLLPLLRDRRYNCIDEIPAERVREDDPNYSRYKCRTNWFNACLNSINLFMAHIPDPLYSELDERLQFFFHEVDWQAMRTRKEIDDVNAMIDKVLAFFEEPRE